MRLLSRQQLPMSPFSSSPPLTTNLLSSAALNKSIVSVGRRREIAGWLLVFFFSLTTPTPIHALTPIPYNCTERGCLNNGICVTITGNNYPKCQCPSNYRGKDCGLQVQVCGDNGQEEEYSPMVCYNGGVCVLAEQSVQQQDYYTCDCPKARHQIPLYEGEFCEKRIYTPCGSLDDGEEEEEEVFSFCVNGGRCTESVSLLDPNSHHTACDCSTAKAPNNNNIEVLAWGDHCEVLHSTAKANKGDGNHYFNDNDDEDVVPNEPLRILAVISLSAALVTMTIYILCKVRASNHHEDQVQIAVEQATLANNTAPTDNMIKDQKEFNGQEDSEEEEEEQKELQSLEEGVKAVVGPHPTTATAETVVRVEDEIRTLTATTDAAATTATNADNNDTSPPPSPTTTTTTTTTTTRWKGQMGPEHFIT